MNKIQTTFGLWPSPISPKRLARGISFNDVAWDNDGTLVWRESRSGQGILVVQPPDGSAPRDLNSDFAASAGVGYGGGDFTVGHGEVYFVEKESKRIYRQPTSRGTARPITPGFGAAASPVVSPDGRHLLFVHTYERKDCLAIVDTEGEFWPQKLISGDDFYMQPCWHPDGERIAWIAWNHPQMPWDGTRLQVASLQVGSAHVGKITTIAGDEHTSIFQPQFSPDGRYLAYICDESGWWQLYLYDMESKEHRQLTNDKAEHGIPAWVQGMRTYGFSPNGEKIFYTRIREGFGGLWQVKVSSRKNKRLSLDSEYTWLEQIALHPGREQLALIASGGQTPTRLITYTEKEGGRVWRRSTSEDLPESTYSPPEALTWQGMDGEAVHGLFYDPRSEQFEGVGSPPLVVLIHGGPTSQRGAGFYPNVQFFTTRGYAVLQVNYRGSTGYGRAYRDMLRGNWGLYDVEDAVSGARHLVAQGRADNHRLVIMGGSAGGFTVLKALEDYPGFFKAGVCMYGVANQFTLVADTHKFEERYSDSLLGPLPQAAEVYRARSPLFFANKIQDPIIVFQGEEDKVVPQAQSDAIVEALRRNGVPHEYHLYPGEGHGFRKAETLEHFYNAVERFLKEHVIFA